MASNPQYYHVHVSSLIDLYLTINTLATISLEALDDNRLIIYQRESIMSPGSLRRIVNRIDVLSSRIDIEFKIMPSNLFRRLWFFATEIIKILRRRRRCYIYSHGISGNLWANLLFLVHPRESLITYGDGWGVFYDRALFFERYVIKKANRIKKLFLRLFKMLFIRVTAPGKFVRAIYNEAGDPVPANTTLIESSLVDVKDVLNAFRAEYISEQTQVKSHAKADTLLVLGNFSESRLCTVENEIALYEEALARLDVFRRNVMVKFHPASDASKNQQILALLNENCASQPQVIDFDKLPIEFIVPDDKTYSVYSFSFSAISLAVLFELQSYYALEKDDILDKFDKRFISYGLANRDDYYSSFRYYDENNNNI